jgi:hypothetical protein
MYYKPTKAIPKVLKELATPIKALIEEEPSFGYRTVAGLLAMNKNTAQRIFQLKGWQVRKRAVASGHGSKRCRRRRGPRTNVGRRICAARGVAATAG